MIKVYGAWPTRSQRVVWLLEELSVPYVFRPVDLRTRGEDAEFQALNPAGFLPVLTDGATTLVESLAIMDYLLGRYGPSKLAPAPADEGYARYQQFFHLGEAGLASQLNVVVASRFFAPEAERENFGAKMATSFFFNRLALVTTQLDSAAFVAGNSFTAADISISYALEFGARLGLAERYSLALRAYMSRLAERPAYQRAVAKAPPPRSP